jgi:precorrin-6Y C5,15-methyltransferase (decarboxylating)
MPSSDGAPGFTTVKWLAVVGIGEDGLDGQGSAARKLIGDAAIVFGGVRHLELAGHAISGSAEAWPTPFDSSMATVLAARGRPVCVLASGDPMLFGVGATLARLVDPAEMIVVPAPSAFSLAAARLGWALQETETVSLHGRPIDLIRPLLHPGRRIIALTSDGAAPAAIARLLADTGFGASTLHVLEALGGGDEVRHRIRADEAGDRVFAPLNTLALEIVGGPDERVLALAAGLPDAMFEHDGQITKREVRALTLSALAPRRGELLWDIGAGSGSIAIEWMLADPSMRAVAIEADATRSDRIARNASALGVPGLRIVIGHAPAALAGLPEPDAIFVGGGGSEAGVMEAAIEALKPGGRLVANAVTLEMEAVLLGLQGGLGGDLTRIAVARAAAVGSMNGWRPAMPVTQWSWVKP